MGRDSRLRGDDREEAVMTITEDGMEVSERWLYARGTGRCAPRPQVIPGALVIPAKAGTYPIAPCSESGNLPEAPCPRKREPSPSRPAAKAGTFPIAPRPRRVPDRSTLSRRVRGVLSPYRERGIRRLRASNGGEIPAYAGMTVIEVGMTEKRRTCTIMERGMYSGRERVARKTGRAAPRLLILPGATSFPRKREPTGGRPPAKAGAYRMRPACAKAGTYPAPASPHTAF